jgi:hypothetical protein
MTLTGDEINLVIYKYLQESGTSQQTTFKQE